MLRTFSWMLIPAMVLGLAPAALADVVITKSGERVYGTVLTETPVGVSILEPSGLMRGFHVDEVQEVRRDPATRTAAGVAEVLERDRVAYEAEWARLQAVQSQRESFFHLGHQLTAGVLGVTAGSLMVGGGAKYRLLVGPYLAAYTGVGYGMGLGRLKKGNFDEDGNLVDTTNVTATALEVPFGLELRFAGLYVGGGAAYLMANNVPTKDEFVVANHAAVVPQVVLGYQYQFKQGPLAVGPVVGLDLRYTPAARNLANGYYGGGIFGGWTF